MTRPSHWLQTLGGAILLFWAATIDASEKHRDGRSPCGCDACCPVGIVDKEKNHSWTVDCNSVCVPPVRRPSGRGCEPGCGTVKRVKVLKRVECEREKRTYKWEVNEITIPGGDPNRTMNSAGTGRRAPLPTIPPPAGAKTWPLDTVR